MTTQHAEPGVVIDIRPLGSRLSESVTSTLVKSGTLEIIRLILPAGKRVRSHQVSGPITVHCLEGRIEFQAYGQWQILESGQLLFLSGGELHAAKAIEDSSVLITIHLTTEYAVEESAAEVMLARYGHDPDEAENA